MYNVREYGVVGDGVTNNTSAFRALVERAAAAGGGALRVPPGRYLTGAVELYSNMTLYLEAGAVLLASGDRGDYPIVDETRVPGLTRRGYGGLVCAYNAENVRVLGEGVIDGQGQNWWFRESDTMRPRLLYFVLCRGLRIEGLTLVNSPCWTVHPLCCENVGIHNLSIRNPPDSPNTDGINPESCRNVRVSGCDIDVGDDCVTIKAGTETDALQRLHPCENVTVTGCTLRRGHGGVVIGSEMSGGVKNVVVSGCVFQGTDRGVRIKTRRGRGGKVENLLFTGILMEDVDAPITMNCYYACNADPNDERLFSHMPRPLDGTTPRIRDVRVSSLRAVGARVSALYALGLPEQPIEGLYLSDVDISMAGEGARPGKPVMSPDCPAVANQGVFLENVSGAVFRAVCVTGAAGEAFRTVNCRDINISSF